MILLTSSYVIDKMAVLSVLSVREPLREVMKRMVRNNTTTPTRVSSSKRPRVPEPESGTPEVREKVTPPLPSSGATR